MSEIRKDLLYTKDHEWVLKLEDGKSARVGITDFAQTSLGDVTYLELPEEGEEVSKNASIGTVESVKSVSEIYAPISGTITKRNEELLDDPAPLNSSPYDDAWLFEVEIKNEAEFSDLLGPEAYESIAQ